ncbi:MAG: tripartite tricarboxylate transporter permease [Xanthobacteraceae bacterium]|nr:tripartite tricarboxylate transporter permease [Xanthobacteraceae bacterium]
MDLLNHLGLGLAVALQPLNLVYALIGTILGTVIGVLPGVGPVATISVLLPITFGLNPTSAIIMLAGIYYGAQYGGSTTAILVRLPGESSSVVTTIDGYQMARQGRAGLALATAALSSFLAGTIATLVVAVAAPALAQVALAFGPADYCALMVFGLVGAVILAQGSIVKALCMIVLGMLLSTVGTDMNNGTSRFVFGVAQLTDGLDFAVVAMGMFGLGETIANIERKDQVRHVFDRIRDLWPKSQDLKTLLPPALRGTVLGSALGVLPGGGPILASFSAYSLEKKISSTPERFGSGALEGVAGPEAANNAAAQTAFIPMLTLGIPATGTMALMIGALMMQGLAPGPQLMFQRPELFWGVIASMWVGNAMLVILNLPLIGVWVKLLSAPYRLLYPSILLFCCIGLYAIHNDAGDVLIGAVFGFLGYMFYRLNCELAPLLLGFVLGPLIEENLRRALLISLGDPIVFVERPISLAFLIMTVVLVVAMAAPGLQSLRRKAFQE